MALKLKVRRLTRRVRFRRCSYDYRFLKYFAVEHDKAILPEAVALFYTQIAELSASLSEMIRFFGALVAIRILKHNNKE